MQAIEANIILKRYKWIVVLILLLIPQLYVYESINAYFIFSMAVFAFSIKTIEQKNNSIWLCLFGMILYVLYLLLQVQSVFLLGYIFLLLVLITYTIGRVNMLPLFVAITSLPFSNTVLNLLSFDIRLQTTRLVTKALNTIVKDVVQVGNVIEYQQMEFSVDDVCAGISMLQVGLLIAFAIIAYYEFQRKKCASFIQLIVLTCLALCMLLLSNALRIFSMVLFHIPEQASFHEILGLISFVVYFILPYVFILRLISNYFSKKIKTENIHQNIHKFNTYLILGSTACMVIFSFYVLKQKKSVEIVHHAIEGYELKSCKYGVAQYSNDKTLLYLKPEIPFYAANHHPRLCWKGSGYFFTNEKYKTIGNKKIVTALLKNDKGDLLYTAYWFQYKQHITSNELTWRWEAMLHHHAYELVNISCGNEKDLMEELSKWIL